MPRVRRRKKRGKKQTDPGKSNPQVQPRLESKASEEVSQEIPKPSSRKKIAFFWYNLAWHTGARVHDYQFLLSLANLGHKVVSYTNSVPTFLRDYPGHKNVTWIIKQPLETPTLKDIDLVVASQGPYLVKALEIAEQRHIPIWIFSYGPEKWFYNEMNERLIDENVLISRYKKADLVITSSDYARNKFISWIPDLEMKLEILTPYIHFEKFPKDDVPKEQSITYCGRLVEYKGYKEFLRWGNEFRKKFCPELKLNLIAGGLIEERGRWTTQFSPHDMIDETSKFKIMKSSIAGFVPSKFETFGLVPGEFLALGVPCIVLDNQTLKSEYGNELIYVDHPEGFFNALKKIMSNGYTCFGLSEDKKKALSSQKMKARLKNIIERRLML